MWQLIAGTDMADFTHLCGVICAVYLLVLSIQDIRSQSVSMWLLLPGIVAAIIYQIVWCEQPTFLWVAGMGTGIGFIGISKVTREGLGYGDSILIFMLGIYLGLWNLLYLLTIAFVLSAVFSMLVLTICRYHRKKTFPFIPFLTIGYFIWFLFQIYSV